MSQVFNSLGGVFKSFFTRSFWLGAFTPCATALVLHLVVGSYALTRKVSFGNLTSGAATDLAPVALVMAGLVVFAYAVSPLARMGRGLLDGTGLPGPLYDLLRAERLAAAQRVAKPYEEATALFEAYDGLFKRGLAELETARTKGLGGGLSDDADKLGAKLAPVVAFSKSIAWGELPPATAGRIAIDALASILRSNRSGLPDPRSVAIDAAHRDLVRALTRGAREAELRLELLRGRHSALALGDLTRATRLGDVRAQVERYSSTRYGVEFDFIWPRVMLLRVPKATFDPVADAQAQVDFAVLACFLMASVPAVWLPVVVWKAENVWAFLALASAGPIVCAVLYELAVIAQRNLGDVVEVVIDENRLEVLESLNQGRPGTLFAERTIWKRLQMAERGGDGRDLVLRYSKP